MWARDQDIANRNHGHDPGSKQQWPDHHCFPKHPPQHGWYYLVMRVTSISKLYVSNIFRVVLCAANVPTLQLDDWAREFPAASILQHFTARRGNKSGVECSMQENVVIHRIYYCKYLSNTPGSFSPAISPSGLCCVDDVWWRRSAVFSLCLWQAFRDFNFLFSWNNKNLYQRW